MVLEVGRICYKSNGRKAGEKAIVINTQENRAEIIYKSGKKEKCSIRHLFPTKEKIDIKNKSVEEIVKIMQKVE
ncbi:MAG: 50S ribosomal protein L14e [Candidatus Diapherotrites archaeon]|nr:50S ribosomal protein L14e [Candidatus Diapherotrites archaeon]